MEQRTKTQSREFVSVECIMQVGDLVTIGGHVIMDDKEVQWVGILLEEVPERDVALVHWNDGKTEEVPTLCLEVIE